MKFPCLRRFLPTTPKKSTVTATPSPSPSSSSSSTSSLPRHTTTTSSVSCSSPTLPTTNNPIPTPTNPTTTLHNRDCNREHSHDNPNPNNKIYTSNHDVHETSAAPPRNFNPDFLVGRTLHKRWRVSWRVDHTSTPTPVDPTVEHVCIDLSTRREVSLRAIPSTTSPSSSPYSSSSALDSELSVYRSLSSCTVGIPRVLDFGEEHAHVFLIVDRMGPSVEAVFRRCGRRFAIRAVVALATQVACRLESLHRRGIAHGCVTPRVLRMGEHAEDARVVFILGGFDNRRRKDAYDCAFAPKKRGFHGDLESFAYVIMYLIRGGTLPWFEFQGYAQDKHYINVNREICMDIEERKRKDDSSSMFIHDDADVDEEMNEFIRYCRSSVRHIDYDYIKRLLGAWYLKINGDYRSPLRWRDVDGRHRRKQHHHHRVKKIGATMSMRWSLSDFDHGGVGKGRMSIGMGMGMGRSGRVTRLGSTYRNSGLV